MTDKEKLAYNRKYQKSHRAEILIRNKRYRLANREAISASKKAIYKRDRKKILAQKVKYHRVNKKAIAARKRAARVALRLEAINCLGGKCAQCEFSDIRALQFDHVNGDGSSHRKRSPSITTTEYRAIAEGRYDGPVLQVLCANCNWIKREELYEVKD